ncbi:hypothetical protein D3C84_549980 [compost metagenome]
MQAHTLETRGQGTVADHVDHRAAEVLAAGGQCGVGETSLDVSQAQFAPLVFGLAAVFSQSTVVTQTGNAIERCAAIGRGEVLAITLKGDGVVGSDFSAETDGALGEARVVLDDGALYPVDAAVRVGQYTVLVVLEMGTTFQLFVGVPVTCGPADRLAFDKAAGFALGAFLFHGHGRESLALGFSVRRGGYAADGQGQYRCAAQFHG